MGSVTIQKYVMLPSEYPACFWRGGGDISDCWDIAGSLSSVVKVLNCSCMLMSFGQLVCQVGIEQVVPARKRESCLRKMTTRRRIIG